MLLLTAEASKDSLLNKRGDQLAINLTIKNTGNTAIKVKSITALLPDKVNAELQVDKQQKSKIELAKDIYRQMEVLVNFNALSLQNSKSLWLKNVKDFLKDLSKTLPNLLLKIYFTPISYVIIRRYFYVIESITIDIKSVMDAKWALDRYIKPTGDLNLINLYEGKLSNLLDLNLENDVAGIIAEIAPAETFTRTYVFTFTRSTWEEKIYSLNFETNFLQGDGLNEQLKEASCSYSVSITPKPLQLTILAAIFSLLGLILKFTMLTKPTKSITEIFKESYNISLTPAIVAIILSIVFFNIYETTGLGKKIPINVNWRGAMLIGIISGMFGDRIIDALKIIAGVS